MKMKYLKLVSIGFIATAVGSTTFAQETSEDPAMAAVRNAVDSSTQAASPASAASSAASAAASAPAVAASGADEMRTMTAKEVRVEKPLTTSQFYGFSFAVKNIDGFGLDSNLNHEPNRAIWPSSFTPPDKKPMNFTSIDGDMFVEFLEKVTKDGKYNDGTHIVTMNNRTKRATLTVYNDRQDPASYTVIGPKGEYTATPIYCEILKAQTHSANYEELGEKARSCNAFFKRVPMNETQKKYVQGFHNTHRKNLEIMKNSIAKSMAEPAFNSKTTAKPWYRDQFDKVLSRLNGTPFKTKAPQTLAQAYPLLTLVESSPQDVKNRQILEEMAEACARLWVNSSGKRPETSTQPTGQKATAN